MSKFVANALLAQCSLKRSMQNGKFAVVQEQSTDTK